MIGTILLGTSFLGVLMISQYGSLGQARCFLEGLLTDDLPKLMGKIMGQYKRLDKSDQGSVMYIAENMGKHYFGGELSAYSGIIRDMRELQGIEERLEKKD